MKSRKEVQTPFSVSLPGSRRSRNRHVGRGSGVWGRALVPARSHRCAVCRILAPDPASGASAGPQSGTAMISSSGSPPFPGRRPMQRLRIMAVPERHRSTTAPRRRTAACSSATSSRASTAAGCAACRCSAPAQRIRTGTNLHPSPARTPRPDEPSKVICRQMDQRSSPQSGAPGCGALCSCCGSWADRRVRARLRDATVCSLSTVTRPASACAPPTPLLP